MFMKELSKTRVLAPYHLIIVYSVTIIIEGIAANVVPFQPDILMKIILSWILSNIDIINLMRMYFILK